MRFFLFIIFSFLSVIALSQPTENSKPNIYALIVGISSYLEKDIPQLQFANRDAEQFAAYLRSKAGGAVADENITLLVDSAATTAAVYNAIYELNKKCGKGDLVYFYFSGHGDLENNTIYKNGFLICYDSPPNNYVRLSLSIEYLNDIANTLSAQTGANVVLITDACHSGKLAGSSNRGNFLVGEQLRAVKKKEIRITSSDANQLSNENEAWGGGRGVFSYYLINGLKGLADKQKDGIVTLDEIKNYLDSSLTNDPVLKRESIVQTPVLNGDGSFQLARVDEAAKHEAEKEMTVDSAQIVMSGAPLAPVDEIPAQPQQYFFSLLKKESLEHLTDSLRLNTLAADDIPFAIIKWFKATLNNNEGQNKLSEFEQLLRTDKEVLKRFNGKLAVALDEKGQQVIDEYLRGDEAELERRRYYNSNSNGYDVYPKMFAAALKLTQPDNYLHGILEVKLHYFTGVALRLKLPTTENFAPLIEQALAEQTKALALEEHAAYIYNELGVLYIYKNNYSKAESYLIKATEIAPEWAIAWSNLAGVYTTLNKFDKAIEAANTAKKIQPGLQGIYVNSGILQEKKGDLLQAEELFRKSIDLNSRHYLPFEKLADVLLKTTSYALADSFYYEADLRKKGFHFIQSAIPYVEPNFIVLPPVPPCPVDDKDVGRNDALGHFALGIIAAQAYDTVKAEAEFRKVINIDRSNPLAFHYLGKLLYNQRRWEEAEIIFKLAFQYHLDTAAFRNYVDSAALKLPASSSHECILNQCRWAYYQQINDRYFLASIYERWDHFTEAEQQYRAIIATDTFNLEGYYKISVLLEKLGRYHDAEEQLFNCRLRLPDREKAERLIADFYRRMVDRFPGEGIWYYKNGLFYYHMTEARPEGFPADFKTIAPDTHTASRIFFPLNSIEDHNHTFFTIPGTLETIYYPQQVFFPRDSGIYYLQKADSLLAEDATIADINDKIGDLYTWQGLEVRSIPHYRKSLDLQPVNSGVSLKLIDALDHNFFYQDALAQLDSLYRRNEINFPKRLLMAKYLVHAGRFTEANELLNKAVLIHPYAVPEIFDLNGRMYLLSKRNADALKAYKDLLSLQPKDPIVMYSMAKLNARLGKDADAWKWLEAALNKGFNYSFVLKYDDDWNVLRRSPRWQTLMKNRVMKSYPKPKT